MIRLLATLAMVLLACCAAEAQYTNAIFFRAAVQDVVILSRFSGTVTPVAVDPMFALTVRIESVSPGVTNFAAGSVVTFAIHSPSRLFAGEDAKGKTYAFLLRCQTVKGNVRYSGLEVERKQANPQGAASGSQPISTEKNSTSSTVGSRR